MNSMAASDNTDSNLAIFTGFDSWLVFLTVLQRPRISSYKVHLFIDHVTLIKTVLTCTKI